MNLRRAFWGVSLVTSVVLTVVGMVNGAVVLLGLATAIELIASIVNGKKKNV